MSETKARQAFDKWLTDHPFLVARVNYLRDRVRRVFIVVSHWIEYTEYTTERTKARWKLAVSKLEASGP